MMSGCAMTAPYVCGAGAAISLQIRLTAAAPPILAQIPSIFPLTKGDVKPFSVQFLFCASQA